MGYKTIGKQQGEKESTVGRYTNWLLISFCLELPARYTQRGVNLMMRKVREQHRCTWQELVDNLKATGATVTKITICNTLHGSRLKSYSSFKDPYSRRNMYRPIWSLQISTWMIQRRVGRKCCCQMSLKLTFFISTRITVFERKKSWLGPKEHHLNH